MGKFLLKIAVNRPLQRYPSVLNGDLNFVIGNANVALELLNGIPGNFRSSSLPERFHRNVVGHRFHSVDTLSPPFGCILIPKGRNETGKCHHSVFDCNGDIVLRAYPRIPF